MEILGGGQHQPERHHRRVQLAVRHGRVVSTVARARWLEFSVISIHYNRSTLTIFK